MDIWKPKKCQKPRRCNDKKKKIFTNCKKTCNLCPTSENCNDSWPKKKCVKKCDKKSTKMLIKNCQQSCNLCTTTTTTTPTTTTTTTTTTTSIKSKYKTNFESQIFPSRYFGIVEIMEWNLPIILLEKMLEKMLKNFFELFWIFIF